MDKVEIIVRLQAAKAAEEAAKREEELKREEARVAANAAAEAAGREWAATKASYGKLKQAAQLATDAPNTGGTPGRIRHLERGEYMKAHGLGPATIDAFLKGAAAVWEEIKEEVERE